MSSIAQLLVIFITITASTPGRSLDYGRTQPPSPPPSSYRRIVFFMRDTLARETPSTLPGDFNHTLSPEPADLVSYIIDLQGLQVGAITAINEYMREDFAAQSPFLGRVRGVYVAVSSDSGEHIMAMTARFAGGEKEDSLRFFGIRQSGSMSSHITVIGGTGRYDGANGYATLKRTGDVEKSLLVNVILS